MTEPASTTEEPTLTDEIGSLLTQIRSHSRRFSRAKNLLKGVDKKEPKAADYEDWLEVHRGLEGYELGIDEVDELRERVVGRIGEQLKRLRVKARMKFMTKLEMLAGAEEIEVQKISESPLVLHLAPLTFEVDFDEGGVTMLYGHEPIEELAIGAKELVEARKKALADMKRQSIPSEEFFDLLYGAYRTVLVRNGDELGARVDLVDVLVPLAVLRADNKKLRKKGVDAISPFSRHLLARQLAKLRRDGLLEKDGFRLDLGAATGGSTRDKDNVLYIPIGATNGQYYGSLKFG